MVVTNLGQLVEAARFAPPWTPLRVQLTAEQDTRVNFYFAAEKVA